LFGSNGLRAGWRLLIYFAVLISCLAVSLKGTGALLKALHWRLRDHLPGKKSVESLLVTQFLILLSAAAAMAVMARIERRSLTDYWIPWKGAFERNFWKGLVWGLAVPGGIVLLIWLRHGYSFGGLALSGRQLIYYSLLWAAVALHQRARRESRSPGLPALHFDFQNKILAGRSFAHRSY
jgi:hypothetical protein